MFSDQEKENYKKIKAPDSLRQKVVTSEITPKEAKPFYKRHIATLAACVVIAVCIIPQMDIIKKEENTITSQNEENVVTEKENDVINASFSESYEPSKEEPGVNYSVENSPKEDNAPVMMTRSLPEEEADETKTTEQEKLSFPVNLNCENGRATVSEGVLHLMPENSSTKISGKEIPVSGDVWAVWEIEKPDITETYELKVYEEGTEKIYKLYYQANWSLERITD